MLAGLITQRPLVQIQPPLLVVRVTPGDGWPTQNETVGARGARQSPPNTSEDKGPATSPSGSRAAGEAPCWVGIRGSQPQSHALPRYLSWQRGRLVSGTSAVRSRFGAPRGQSTCGRAPPSQGGGSGFEARCPLQGHWPPSPHWRKRIAQATSNGQVLGSSPRWGSARMTRPA